MRQTQIPDDCEEADNKIVGCLCLFASLTVVRLTQTFLQMVKLKVKMSRMSLLFCLSVLNMNFCFRGEANGTARAFWVGQATHPEDHSEAGNEGS